MSDPIFAPRLMFPPGQSAFIFGMECVLIALYFTVLIGERRLRYHRLRRKRQRRETAFHDHR